VPADVRGGGYRQKYGAPRLAVLLAIVLFWITRKPMLALEFIVRMPPSKWEVLPEIVVLRMVQPPPEPKSR
jgi:hypothetical protein